MSGILRQHVRLVDFLGVLAPVPGAPEPELVSLSLATDFCVNSIALLAPCSLASFTGRYVLFPLSLNTYMNQEKDHVKKYH